ALFASVNRPHVRFASESDRIAAQQRNDAQCHQQTTAGTWDRTSRAVCTKIFAAGLMVRFFRVTIPICLGLTSNLIGKALIAKRLAPNQTSERGNIDRN